MAQAKRNDIDHGAALPPHHAAGDRRYDAGGHVARLHADLARRLTDQDVLERRVAVESPAERLVRRCSAMGGYGALLMGYAGAAFALVHWL